MDAIVGQVPVVLQALFSAAEPLARQTGFVVRLRRLHPAAFARTFCLFLIRYPKASLEQLAAELKITAAALCEQLRKPAAADFLVALLGYALQRLAAAAVRPVAIPLLRRFNGVYLTDGTSLPLPAALAGRFAGCGGGEGPDDPSAVAAVKILLRLRLDAAQAAEVLLGAARTPDVRLLRRLTDLPAGALHIADLGFFDSDAFADFSRRGVYWLTRLPARVSVRPDHGVWQELAWFLRDLDRRGVDRWAGTLAIVQLAPVWARVFVHRCPPEEAARRRHKLQDRMRRKGKTAGVRQLALCDWWVLATNVPAGMLNAAEARELYRSRWQVELAFKRWKSLGGLAIDRQHAPTRALCELYGKLLGVLLVDWLALHRGGLLAGRSIWRAWQIVLEMLPQITLALGGRLPWADVLTHLARRLDRRRPPPRRTKRPSTRQRLFRATLGA
jgi:Transposase DDE domain